MIIKKLFSILLIICVLLLLFNNGNCNNINNKMNNKYKWWNKFKNKVNKHIINPVKKISKKVSSYVKPIGRVAHSFSKQLTPKKIWNFMTNFKSKLLTMHVQPEDKTKRKVKLALLALSLARYVYRKKQNGRFTRLGTMIKMKDCKQPKLKLIGAYNNQHIGSQAMVVEGVYSDKFGQHKILSISFRGSDSLKDWINNLDFAATKFPYCQHCGNVHRGFLIQYKSIRNKLRRLLSRYKSKQSSYAEILITGHSLGGALAYLCTLDMIRNWKWNAKNIHLITFGGARVGDATFKKRFREVFVRSNQARYVTTLGDKKLKFFRQSMNKFDRDDPATEVPLFLTGYRHVYRYQRLQTGIDWYSTNRLKLHKGKEYHKQLLREPKRFGLHICKTHTSLTQNKAQHVLKNLAKKLSQGGKRTASKLIQKGLSKLKRMKKKIMKNGFIPKIYNGRFVCPRGTRIVRIKKTTTNGCGPSSVGYGKKMAKIVSKISKRLARGFHADCIKHDHCYDSCGKKRSVCDKEFKKLIVRRCKSLSIIKRVGCMGRVGLIMGIIRIGGGRTFKRTQRDKCRCFKKKKPIKTVKKLTKKSKDVKHDKKMLKDLNSKKVDKQAAILNDLDYYRNLKKKLKKKLRKVSPNKKKRKNDKKRDKKKNDKQSDKKSKNDKQTRKKKNDKKRDKNDKHTIIETDKFTINPIDKSLSIQQQNSQPSNTNINNHNEISVNTKHKDTHHHEEEVDDDDNENNNRRPHGWHWADDNNLRQQDRNNLDEASRILHQIDPSAAQEVTSIEREVISDESSSNCNNC